MSDQSSQFEELNQSTNPSLFREFVSFTLHSGKWWMFPLLMVMCVMGLLMMTTGTGLAPLIYALF